MSGSRSSFVQTKYRPPNSRPAGNSEECTVCRTEPDYFPSFPPTETCAHRSQVCHDCLQEFISTAVLKGRVQGGIACPSEHCEGRMEHSDVKTWAKDEVFQTSVDYVEMANHLTPRLGMTICFFAFGWAKTRTLYTASMSRAVRGNFTVVLVRSRPLLRGDGPKLDLRRHACGHLPFLRCKTMLPASSSMA